MPEPLASRVELKPLTATTDAEEESPEDILFSSLATVFPDDAGNLHGDANSQIVYHSPHLPNSLTFKLSDPSDDGDRKLMSHFMWNASLLMAELMERDSLDLSEDGRVGIAEKERTGFDVKGLRVLEMGSGTGLPSVMAGLVGAEVVVATDYPSDTIINPLRTNLTSNIVPCRSPTGKIAASFRVFGHEWGEFQKSGSYCAEYHQNIDRVIISDCLWMPWQHTNLLKSVDYFLSKSARARCWCVGGFHTGRKNVSKFLEDDVLKQHDLRVEKVWEREVDGNEREWDAEGKEEDAGTRKRWVVIAVLKRRLDPPVPRLRRPTDPTPRPWNFTFD